MTDAYFDSVKRASDGFNENLRSVPETVIKVPVNQVEAMEIIDWLASAGRKMEWVPPFFDDLEQELSDFVYGVQ